MSATLFTDAREWVRMEHWAPNAEITLDDHGGVEILCLEGAFVERGETFEKQSWLRLPADMALAARAGANGCRVWLKQGHLRDCA
jgi:hypothetical protein